MKKINWSDYPDSMVQSGVKLMKEINDAGYEAYIVGGAVRDIAMGDTNIHDIDIGTNMPIADIKKRYKTVEYGGGEKHGTVIVRFEENDYELTQFRTEGKYTDKRRPDEVTFGVSFEEDTSRRDFTWNAMGIDYDGNLIDFHGGLDDIKNKKLRTVGDARQRFYEGDDGDVLRMLRAIRFAARFNFDVDQGVIDAIKDLKSHITETSMERIRDEIIKIMDYGGEKFANALKLLSDTGLWNEIAPEINVSDDKINAVKDVNTQSPEINFSIVMNDLTPNQAFSSSSKFMLDNKQKKTIAYIVSNLDNYSNLDKIDKQLALKIVNNPDFGKLKAVYIGLNKSDINNSDDIVSNIMAFNDIVDRQKGINKAIMNSGIKGADFGRIVKKINEWLFDEYEKGNVPSDDEVRYFIKENR